jgi:hypothetical protein
MKKKGFCHDAVRKISLYHDSGPRHELRGIQFFDKSGNLIFNVEPPQPDCEVKSFDVEKDERIAGISCICLEKGILSDFQFIIAKKC